MYFCLNIVGNIKVLCVTSCCLASLFFLTVAKLCIWSVSIHNAYKHNPKSMRGVFHHPCPTGIILLYSLEFQFSDGDSWLGNIFVKSIRAIPLFYLKFLLSLSLGSLSINISGSVLRFVFEFCLWYHISCVCIVQLLKKSLSCCNFVWNVNILYTYIYYKHSQANVWPSNNSCLMWCMIMTGK